MGTQVNHGLEGVLGDYPKFLTDILGLMEREGFEMTDFVQMDHMCYRTISAANYEQKKREMLAWARLIGETVVNGRLIATFRLNRPVKQAGWRVDLVEIPAPAEGRKYSEGLEHVEFVLFDEKTDFLLKYPDKPFNLASAERGINPEIGLKLGKYGVKFHLLNLAAVVYLEKKLGITEVK